jgi:hypothetical protein
MLQLPIGVVGSSSRLCGIACCSVAVRRTPMPKCHDVRQFAPIQPRIERLHREPFRTSEEAIDDSPDSLFQASVEMARRRFDGVAAYSTCRSTRATGCSIRRARWPPPVRYIGTKAASPCSSGYRVKSLISRTCGSSPREWTFHIAPSAPQELLSAINPFEFACANRVRKGRSDRCLV